MAMLQSLYSKEREWEEKGKIEHTSKCWSIVVIFSSSLVVCCCLSRRLSSIPIQFFFLYICSFLLPFTFAVCVCITQSFTLCVSVLTLFLCAFCCILLFFLCPSFLTLPLLFSRLYDGISIQLIWCFYCISHAHTQTQASRFFFTTTTLPRRRSKKKITSSDQFVRNLYDDHIEQENWTIVIYKLLHN